MARLWDKMGSCCYHSTESVWLNAIMTDQSKRDFRECVGGFERLTAGRGGVAQGTWDAVVQRSAVWNKVLWENARNQTYW